MPQTKSILTGSQYQNKTKWTCSGNDTKQK